MMPAAPARFSITTDCFHFSASLAATVRAEMSVPPPGGKGTIHVTALSGYAAAARETARPPRKSTPRESFDVTNFSPVLKK